MNDTIEINEEAAEQEVYRFLKAMGIKVDNLDAEDQEAFDEHKGTLVDALRDGSLVINDDGEPVFTPQRKASRYKEPLTFHERTGADLMASDKHRPDDTVKKMFEVMASLTKTRAKVFSDMAGSDLNVCRSVFTLLMG